MSVVVVNYGAGNLASVAKALDYLGCENIISSRPEDVRSASVLFLPGVGTAGDIIDSLTRLRLLEAIVLHIQADRPYFGICLGLQILFESSEESGGRKCLGLLPGRVVKLPAGVKVPHIGWNSVKQTVRHRLFDGVSDDSSFYFVHSYCAIPGDPSVVAGETSYGAKFASLVIRGNLVATQFHPEKSGEQGLKLLGNFLRLHARP